MRRATALDEGHRAKRHSPRSTESPAAEGPAGSTTDDSRRGRAATRENPVAREAVAGVTLSSPDKPDFPETGLTKLDLARYYESVAAWILPHLERRPLSLVRCPDGWSLQCFYQKHADPSVHEAVTRVEVPENDGPATYFSASTGAALVGLVQWGVIEMHPWGARSPRLDRPDRLTFDFDPDESLPWHTLVAAVRQLRELLAELHLTAFLKTTGGKGLHVVLPIRATLSWEVAKSFSRAVADLLVRTTPDLFTANAAKASRKGRIFIDYLRNARGATAIAPYAVRARERGPVAMPIAWSELASDVRFAHFNLGNAARRLDRRTDPWADFLGTHQVITVKMRERLG